MLLDVQGLCSFADYFVICTGESQRQIDTIVDAIEQALKQEGVRPLHREGTADSGWVLLDYAAVVVHIFDPESRERYKLADLWRAANPLVRFL